MPEAGQRISSYLLLEKVGQGGFGEVWKARHHTAEETVAVKIPTDPEFVEQLRREGAIQRVLRHDHIVQTLELDASADPPYFIMEFIEGRSLRQLLQKRGSLSLHETIEVSSQILSALQFAHERGVVHRDIKPGNILISRSEGEGRYCVKVADFGLGHVSETLASSLLVSGKKTSSQGRSLAGTMDYMSPEQKKGAPADARNDLYSFGLVFYEILVGKLPVGAFPLPSEIYPDIPRKVDSFLKKCLAPEAANRFLSAEEALRYLSNLDGGGGGGVPFVLSNGTEVFRLGELISAIENSPEEGRYHLYEGDLSSWLRSIREKSLARVADRIRRDEADPDVGLQKFMEATGMISVPQLDLDVQDLDLGEISPGAYRTFRVYVSRVGKGILWGQAKIAEAFRWVRPAKVHFKGETSSVEFTISTRDLEMNRKYEFQVKFESNGGTKILPVCFRISPESAQLEVIPKECVLSLTGRQSLLLKNTGGKMLSWRTYGFPRWLEVPLSGEIPPQESRSISLKVKRSAGEVENAEGRLRIRSNGGEISVRISTRSS